MEDIRTASNLVSHHSVMATVDLKEAYFVINIHKDYRKYLRFRFNGILYEFTCLPFGLCSAPFVFTKRMKPLLSFLRREGHQLVAYLDDVWCVACDYLSCSNTVSVLINNLEKLGFVINYEKSCTIPDNICKFLGFQINSINMTLELPYEKRCKIYELVLKMSKNCFVKIREFAQFVGTLTAACPAVAYGWLYTKKERKVSCPSS